MTIATYVLTGTIGALPAGYVDATATIATVTVNIVVAPLEITAAKAIADVAVVTGDGKTLDQIKTALGTTVILLVDAEEVTVPVTWETDTVAAYNNAAAATYVLTGTIGTLPTGYVDVVAPIATVTVNIVVTTPTPEEYFTFVIDNTDNTKGTITDYNVVGGLNVVIPSTIDGVAVTSIGADAFYNNLLATVTIPNSVTSIGTSAFAYNQLTSVTIGSSVTSIGDYAFYSNGLTSVIFGVGINLTSIGDAVFAYNLLTSVTIPNSVKSIGVYAFEFNQLASVTFGVLSNLTSIGARAFQNNQLTSVTIPNLVTSIGDSAFESNGLTSVTIGANVNIDSTLTTTMGTYGAAFLTLYNADKLAGTYNYTGGVWGYTPAP